MLFRSGLIPENELSLKAGVELDKRTKGAIVDENYQTNVEGIFVAGNVLHVHDLVDFVSLEGERLASEVSKYVQGENLKKCNIEITTDSNINHTIPQRISGTKDFVLSMRVKKPRRDCKIDLEQDGEVIKSFKFKKVIPAEMIQINILKEDIKSQGEIKVEIGRASCRERVYALV